MFLLLQKDIGFLFVFVKRALFPYVSFRCACRFCKQMRLVYRQAVRSDVVTVTAIQEYPYKDTIAGIERMGNCILDCTGHEFVRPVVGSSMSTTRAFCVSLRMLITLPCYVRNPFSFPLPRPFLYHDGGLLSFEYKKYRSLYTSTVQNQSSVGVTDSLW
jgi:hypothetical protein